MPRIDVTELFTDPDFVQTFDVVRSIKDTGDDGFTETREQVFPKVTGSVQPAPNSTLQRLADGSHLNSVIEVWTKHRLTNGMGDELFGADSVIFKGYPYTVMEVADWSDWGAGFVKATCHLATNSAKVAS